MIKDTIRDGFEKWMLEQKDMEVRMRPEGFYAVPTTHHQWQAYKACAAELLPVIRGIRELAADIGFGAYKIDPFEHAKSCLEQADDIKQKILLLSEKYKEEL